MKRSKLLAYCPSPPNTGEVPAPDLVRPILCPDNHRHRGHPQGLTHTDIRGTTRSAETKKIYRHAHPGETRHNSQAQTAGHSSLQSNLNNPSIPSAQEKKSNPKTMLAPWHPCTAEPGLAIEKPKSVGQR